LCLDPGIFVFAEKCDSKISLNACRRKESDGIGMKNKKMLIIMIILVIVSIRISSAGLLSSEQKISPSVHVSEMTDGKIPIIIILKDQPKISSFQEIQSQQKNIEKSQTNLMSFFKTFASQGKADDVKSLWLINAVATKATTDVINTIAQREDVRSIEYDELVHIVDNNQYDQSTSVNAWGIEKINATAVWAMGNSGAGVVVAVLDTGVDASHPDLNDLDDNPSTNDPKIILWKDYVKGIQVPYDDNSHGTHVSGIISGTGEAGVKTGVAPRTRLIEAKVFDANGTGRTSDSIAAFGWAVSNRANVISYSGGGDENSDIWTTAINNVVAAGVVPVIAAGNNGPFPRTILIPGNQKEAITVGATDKNDKIAFFSSRGPVTLNGETYIKPDVSAPGIAIVSTIPGGGYDERSGTSMAAPFVSGTVALILERNSSLTPLEVKYRLESTAVDPGIAGKDNDYGSGRIDAFKAVAGRASLMKGDVDSNRCVDARDALKIVKYTFVHVGLTAEQLKSADTSDDGSVTITDALNIVYWLKDPSLYPFWNPIKDSDMMKPVTCS
jgi:serine protease AprX